MGKNVDDYTTSLCLSFSSYTGDRIAETVDRVLLEVSDESNNDEFEFVCETVSSSFPGDGDIVFPLFNQLIRSTVKSEAKATTQLRDLFLRDPEDWCSSSNGGWRRSKSTGTSSSRIKDSLKRSFSERKRSFRSKNKDESSKKKENVVYSSSSSSAFEKFYLKKKAMKEEEKRKSYLPYKKDFFGFIFNIHRYGKTLNPF